MERGLRLHIYESFNIVFDAQSCSKSYKEAKRVKFERLVQGSISVVEYETMFLELLEFCPYLIPNEDKNKRRFLDELSDVIASGISIEM